MLEEGYDTEPEIEGDARLNDGNGKEGEGEDVDPKEDGGEDHAGAVGDDEEQGGDQPGEDQPAGSAHRAVHQHNAELGCLSRGWTRHGEHELVTCRPSRRGGERCRR